MPRLLAIRLSAMGDVAMTVPVITTVLNRYPELELDLLSRSTFAPLFPKHGRLKLIHPQLNTRHKGLSGLFRLYRDMKVNQYDCIADLHDVLRSQVLRGLFRFSTTRIAVIEKGRRDKHRLTRKKRKVLKPLKTTIERYAAVFARLGYPIEVSKEKMTSGHHGMIGIAPFAAWKQKMWPIEKSTRLIHALVAKTDSDILLFGGGEGEIRVLDEMAEMSSKVRSVAHLDLAAQLNLISMLDAMVSMDSANAHLASNLSVPVVSIWGATHPYAGFAPFGQNDRNAIQREDLPCRPCSVYGNKPCWRGDLACLDIEVNVVVKKVLEVVSA